MVETKTPADLGKTALAIWEFGRRYQKDKKRAISWSAAQLSDEMASWPSVKDRGIAHGKRTVERALRSLAESGWMVCNGAHKVMTPDPDRRVVVDLKTDSEETVTIRTEAVARHFGEVARVLYHSLLLNGGWQHWSVPHLRDKVPAWAARRDYEGEALPKGKALESAIKKAWCRLEAAGLVEKGPKRGRTPGRRAVGSIRGPSGRRSLGHYFVPESVAAGCGLVVRVRLEDAANEKQPDIEESVDAAAHARVVKRLQELPEDTAQRVLNGLDTSLTLAERLDYLDEALDMVEFRGRLMSAV